MKKRISKISFILFILLLALFIVFITIDYVNYNSILTSFPFYTNIIVRGIEFLLPSVVCFIISFILRKKK